MSMHAQLPDKTYNTIWDIPDWCFALRGNSARALVNGEVLTFSLTRITLPSLMTGAPHGRGMGARGERSLLAELEAIYGDTTPAGEGVDG